MHRQKADEALSPCALVEPIVEQAHVGALQVRLVGSGGVPQQPCLFPHGLARGIDVQIHERHWRYARSPGRPASRS